MLGRGRGRASRKSTFFFFYDHRINRLPDLTSLAYDVERGEIPSGTRYERSIPDSRQLCCPLASLAQLPRGERRRNATERWEERSSGFCKKKITEENLFVAKSLEELRFGKNHSSESPVDRIIEYQPGVRVYSLFERTIFVCSKEGRVETYVKFIKYLGMRIYRRITRSAGQSDNWWQSAVARSRAGWLADCVAQHWSWSRFRALLPY